MSQSKAKSKKNWATLPLSRVNTIMRSSPDVSSVSPDAIALTAKAAELFITQLAKDSHQHTNDKSKLDYNDISSLVYTDPRMAFLQDIIPKKIKAKEYFEIINNLKKNNKEDIVLDVKDGNEMQSEGESEEQDDKNDEKSDREENEDEAESDQDDEDEG